MISTLGLSVRNYFVFSRNALVWIGLFVCIVNFNYFEKLRVVCNNSAAQVLPCKKHGSILLLGENLYSLFYVSSKAAENFAARM